MMIISSLIYICLDKTALRRMILARLKFGDLNTYLYTHIYGIGPYTCALAAFTQITKLKSLLKFPAIPMSLILLLRSLS